MTITADTATSTTNTVEVPPATDHAISIETAADVLNVQPATVRRYLRAGRLVPLDGGISADSVTAYAAARTVNITRTRFKAAAPVGPVEAAAAMWAEATKLEAQARRLKKLARPVLEEAGPGTYGPFELEFTAGQMRQDQELIDVFWYAMFGEKAPRALTKPGPKVTPAI